MPQPQLMQRAETFPPGKLAIGANPSAGCRRELPDGDPVTVFLNDPDKPAAPSRGGLAAEKTPVLAFQRLRIMLANARSAAGDGPSPDAAEAHPELAQGETAGDLEDVETLAFVPAADTDPVIGHLSDALAAAERGSDQHSGIYADAVRLAMMIRLLGQHSEAQRPTDAGEAAEQISAVRQVRALQKWRLKRVFEYVDNHLSGKITLVELAAVAGLSRMHFASQFRAATGLRPHEYLLRQRIRRAEELLLGSAMPIVEIALTVGFQTQAHFTTVFKRFVGYTPYQWRNAGRADGLTASPAPRGSSVRLQTSAAG